ncbi:MAG: acylphosphatase [Bdellovibrionales bacterium]|nr:acylphosphatase [Bdellovibrionales bacterium]
MKGKVQGVGFRYFVLGVAKQLGVQGWVRNRKGGEYDGNVEILAIAEDSKMEAFLAEVQNGPPSSNVTGLEIQESIEDFKESCFSIVDTHRQ